MIIYCLVMNYECLALNIAYLIIIKFRDLIIYVGILKNKNLFVEYLLRIYIFPSFFLKEADRLCYQMIQFHWYLDRKGL